MELPAIQAKLAHKLRFGHYVVGRLRVLKLDDQAERVLKVSARLRDAAIALDGLSAEVQQAIAERDHWVDAYEQRVRDFIATLDKARTLHLVKRSIFAGKPKHFLEVPLAELESRAADLVERVERFVPDEQAALRKKTCKAIKRRVEGFVAATQAMSDKRAEVFAARKKREKAAKRWHKTLGELFDELQKRLGEAQAEKIYPPLKRVQSLAGDDAVGSLGKIAGDMSLQRLAMMQR